MNNKTKIIIAVVLFALAAVVVAYQFGLFGESKPKREPGAAVQQTGGDSPAVVDGGVKPAG